MTVKTDCYMCKYGEKIEPPKNVPKGCLAPATCGGTRCTLAPMSYSLISFDNDVFKCKGYEPKEVEK